MFDILLFDVLSLELDTRTRHFELGASNSSVRFSIVRCSVVRTRNIELETSNSSIEVEYRTRPLRSYIFSKFHPLEVPSSRSYILSKLHPLEVPSSRSSILSKFNPLEVTSHRISISSNFEYRTSNIELRASNCSQKRDTPGLTHSTKLVSSFMTILLGYF
jgi:hypothetical protein